MSAELPDSEICLTCQACCKYFMTPMPWARLADLIKAKEYYKARGAKKVISINNRIWAVWEIKCPHLTKIGCDIYEHRPQACREFNGHQDPLLKDICKLPESKLIVLPGKGERV